MNTYFWYLSSFLLILITPTLQDCQIDDELPSGYYVGYRGLSDGLGRPRPPPYFSSYTSFSPRYHDRLYGRPFGPSWNLKCTEIDFLNLTCPELSVYRIYTYALITDSEIPKIPANIFEECTSFTNKIRDLRIEEVSVANIEPSAFGSLTNLDKLSLSRNNLVEIKTHYFENMSEHLNSLYLGFNQIKSIEDGSFDGLNSLVDLELQYNLLDMLDSNVFNGLHELVRLNLANNKLRSIGKDIFKNLPHLMELDLTANKITNIDSDAFSSNGQLENLFLSQNYLHDISKVILPNATNYFNVSHNAINDASFENLRNVLVLDLSSNTLKNSNFVTGNNPMMTKYLKCDHNQFGEKSTNIIKSNIFENFENVEIFDLSSNEFETFDIALIDHMKKLENFSLADNYLGSLDFKNVSEKLQVLDLSRNFLRSIEGMTHLSVLKSLDLSSNKLKEIPANMFAGMTGLETLNMRNNEITSLKLGCFRDVKNLKLLDLSENDISVLEVGIFSGPSITTLKLAHNQLTSLDEGILHSEHRLRMVDLSYNKFNASSVLNWFLNLNLEPYRSLKLDIQGNYQWRCSDILKIMHTGRINIELVPGNDTDVTNIKGIGCINQNNPEDIIDGGDNKPSSLQSPIYLDRIGDKLSTTNTLMILILLLLVAMCVVKCIPSAYFQKIGVFRWKRHQGMELLPESGYENNI